MSDAQLNAGRDEPEVRLITLDDTEPLLAFEEANRSFFEAHIGARPKDFYSRLGVANHIKGLLSAVASNDAIPAIIEQNDQIIGRVNLTRLESGGVARLGYRVAECWTGRGVATFAVGWMLQRAPGLSIDAISAIVSTENIRSHRVLIKHGFAAIADHQNYCRVDGRLLDCIEYCRSETR